MNAKSNQRRRSGTRRPNPTQRSDREVQRSWTLRRIRRHLRRLPEDVLTNLAKQLDELAAQDSEMAEEGPEVVMNAATYSRRREL